MGLWTKIFGGADGCREAMHESYAKHVQMARQGISGVENIDDAHYIGLYGALGSRYRVRGHPINEAQIMAELAPFCAMENEQQAIEALAEYVLYQEGRNETRTEWLNWCINSALQACKEEHWLGLAAMGLINRVKWCDLLNPEMRNELERLTDLVSQNTAPITDPNCGNRKDPMKVVASIASVIDEVIRVGGVAELETSILRLDKNDGITIATRQSLSVCEAEFKTKVRTKGEVYIYTLPEFKYLKSQYKFTFPNPEASPLEVEHLAEARYELVSQLAIAAYRDAELAALENGRDVNISPASEGVAVEPASRRNISAEANQMHAKTQYNLGVTYAYGQGVTQDYQEAMKLFRLSAEQGITEAQCDLGAMHQAGYGVPQDYAQAMMWYLIAKANGSTLPDQNLHQLESLTTPAQIAEAQRMAKEWTAAHPKKS